MGEDSRKTEIFCPVCGKVTLVVRRPVFEGLRKIGEKLSCVACETEFEEDTEVDFVEKEAPKVFSEEDGVRLCLHCVHYIVNPFTQRCTLHTREVEATDTCPDFVQRKERKREEEEKKEGSDVLKELFGEAADGGSPEKQ